MRKVTPASHGPGPMRQRVQRRPLQASCASCTLCTAAITNRGNSPGFACHAAARLPSTSAAQARVPPHRGQGRPVSWRKAHRGTSPSATSTGAIPKASGQPSTRTERHWRSATLSDALSGMGQCGRVRAGDLLGHVVHTNDCNGHGQDDAHATENGAQ